MISFSSRLADETKYLRASEIRDLLKLTEGKNVISFAGGLPDPSTFPTEDIKKIIYDVLDTYSSQALQYGTTSGVTLLRKALVDFSSLRGITGITEDDITVTVGSEEALYLIFNTLINPGDIVIVEAPSYVSALNILRARRPELIGIELTQEGMNLDKLEEVLKQLKNEGKTVKLLYTIPTAQNPGGVTMPLENRKRLLELASEYDFVIVEDDAYGFIVFDGESPPALKALDKEGRVLYLGTFSKILAPGFRLGWLIVQDRNYRRVIEMLKASIDLHTPTLTQYIAAEAIRRGIIINNIPKIRRIYKEKRDAMLEALEEYFPKDAEWSKPIGGMFVFAWLPKKINTTDMLMKAMERGVAYVPGAGFYPDLSGTNTMRINFSYPKIEEIQKGIKILGDTIKDELSR